MSCRFHASAKACRISAVISACGILESRCCGTRRTSQTTPCSGSCQIVEQPRTTGKCRRWANCDRRPKRWRTVRKRPTLSSRTGTMRSIVRACGWAEDVATYEALENLFALNQERAGAGRYSPLVARAPSVSPRRRGDPPPPRLAQGRTRVPLWREPPPPLRGTSPAFGEGGRRGGKVCGTTFGDIILDVPGGESC